MTRVQQNTSLRSASAYFQPENDPRGQSATRKSRISIPYGMQKNTICTRPTH
ncbi:hypothetical protein CY34DRAFT_804600 [Suillus luteus UH-Slu-Lm8-n1]|uniref:Uncharacterized protein n=1 Tax=Suillus luteus UH-Slu-Lm8-n1 TaxID=930992 RepID=A0A0C9ZY93_9AGAM|nr:hypothetical protein CY34DRAFT_804600 [Suillus luteus UH-Slu-Lm8-n1]